MGISPVSSSTLPLASLPVAPAAIQLLQANGLSLGKLAKDQIAFEILDSYLDAHAWYLAKIAKRPAHGSTPVEPVKHVYELTREGNLRKLVQEALALSTFMAIA